MSRSTVEGRRSQGSLLLLVGMLLLAAPLVSPLRVGGLRAQERTLTLSAVTISAREATLDLSFSDGGALSASLEEGRVLLNGELLGEVPPAGSWALGWRTLLSELILLTPTEVPARLLAWEAPEEGGGSASTLLRTRLSEALAPLAQGTDRAMGTTLSRLDRARTALTILPEWGAEQERVYLGETITIPAGERLSLSVVLIDGALDVAGVLDGDLLLLGSVLDLTEGGRVEGRVYSAGGTVLGDATRVTGGTTLIEVPTPSPLLRAPPPLPVGERQGVTRRTRSDSTSRSATPRDRLMGGLAALGRALLYFGVLLGAGTLVSHLAPARLEVVAGTLRHSTTRSLLLGGAGTIFFGPLFIVGVLLLAISIVGIPLLLLWVPGFPILMAISFLLGLLAATLNLGSWIAGRSYPPLARFDWGRLPVRIAGGAALLVLPLVLAALFRMAGSWFTPLWLLLQLTWVLIFLLTGLLGLGGVILSRGGRVRTFSGLPDPSVTAPTSGSPPTDSAREVESDV